MEQHTGPLDHAQQRRPQPGLRGSRVRHPLRDGVRGQRAHPRAHPQHTRQESRARDQAATRNAPPPRPLGRLLTLRGAQGRRAGGGRALRPRSARRQRPRLAQSRVQARVQQARHRHARQAGVGERARQALLPHQGRRSDQFRADKPQLAV